MAKEIKLLVVANDIGVQKIIKKALKKSFLNTKVDYVSKVSEASILHKKNSWDIVLTDFNLDENSSGETIRFFKIQICTPVIVIKDLHDEEFNQLIGHNEGFDVVSKNLISSNAIGFVIINAMRSAHQQEKINGLSEELKNKEKQIEEFQTLSGLGLWELSSDNKKIIWSKEIAQIFNKDLITEISLGDFYNMVVQEEREQVVHLFNLILKKGIGFERTISFEVLNNQIVHVLICAKCKSEDGMLSRVHGTMMDVSHQKAVERYLIEEKLNAEKSAKTKQDFWAGISHEIRTPMSSILGFTEIILENNLDQGIRDKITSIKTSGENLMVILDDVLDIAKIESGQLEAENTDYNLKDVLNHVNIQLKSLAKRKNIKLKHHINKATPIELKGDPVRLGQILINLVNNALKFTEKGSVEIRVKPIEEKGSAKIQFEIEDTGIGISKLNQDTIFEAYSQVSSSGSRKYGGTGLGLSISKKLVHLLGGQIWLESQENTGSTFYFTISNENRGNINKKIERQSAEKLDIEGVKLLLVEDNSINREFVIHFLNEWKVSFQVAVNGKQGVEIAQMTDFDLILMDVSMPLLDGYQATKKIRSFDNLRKSTPILAMTAKVFDEDVQKCLSSGMNDYISKPFRADELKFKIHNLVKVNRNLPLHENYIRKSIDDKKEQVFSLDLLKEMGGNNQAFINDMLRIYIEESPKTLKKLNEAHNHWNIEGIKSAAHKLRSPSAMMGVSKAVELTEFIEVNVSKSEKQDEVKSAIISLIKLIQLAIEQAKGIS